MGQQTYRFIFLVSFLFLIVSIIPNGDASAKDEAVLKLHASPHSTKSYGRLVGWDQAKVLIPVKSTFKVIDVDSGLSFHVQRRAGNKHADVQPLTKNDTAIMKRIYESKWSWKRKAIIVQSGKKYLAASMNGMPHGGDGIPDNDFDGHFCIHFLGSTTHGSGNVDFEHQLMVHKAAGELKPYLAAATPYEVVNTFLTAMKMREKRILTMTMRNPVHSEYFIRDIDDIKAIHSTWLKAQEDVSSLIMLEIPVTVKLFYERLPQERITFLFLLIRTSHHAPWKIDSIGLIS